MWVAVFALACSGTPVTGTPASAPTGATAPGAELTAPRPRPNSACAVSAALLPGVSPAASPGVPRRLSVTQYENALRDLLRERAVLKDVLVDLERNLRQLPRDGEVGASFPEMDARIGQRHVGTFVRIADEVAHAITRDPARLSALAGPCAAAGAADAACLERFTRDWGERVFRRPLSDVEVERWLGRAGAAQGADVYRVIVAGLLASSEFWLRGDAGVNPSEAQPAFELASRLSFHFWRTGPDATLLGAAQSGELTRSAGYRAQVERLTRHQRARATWYSFFRQWLRLDGFEGFATDRAFETLSAPLKVEVTSYDDAVWEIEELVGHYTFDTDGRYPDLLLSDEILTRSRRIAALYAVDPWDGHSAPATFRAGERSGLLTRAALLMSGSHATNPFARGAFVRRQLLCEAIEPPAQRPPDAFVVPPFDPKTTTRTRHENKVSSAGCKSCHELFSPYGYVLEAYDALGRYRASERLIDDGGSLLGELPVNVAARVDVGAESRVDVRGPVELSAALAESREATECLARQYFRFTFQRQETPSDACVIEELTTALDERGLRSLFRDVAFTKAFTRGLVAL